jgi:hypothetical protein
VGAIKSHMANGERRMTGLFVGKTSDIPHGKIIYLMIDKIKIF